jgi:3-oxoadipate enol-lactonase
MTSTTGLVWHVEVSPGVRLAVTVSGASDAPTILLANSLAADMRMWEEVTQKLVPYARLVRYDMRGHGKSDVPSEGYSLDVLASDMVAVLDTLDIDRAFVCGLSLGGLAAMQFAVQAPERARGLVIANSTACFMPASMWRDRAQTVLRDGMGALVEPTLARWFTPDFRKAAPERVNEIAAMIASAPVAGYVLADGDMRETLPGISCPTLVIAGRHDPSTPVSRSEEIAAAIPNAELIVLNAAHMSAVEDPVAFAAAVLAFVGKG